MLGQVRVRRVHPPSGAIVRFAGKDDGCCLNSVDVEPIAERSDVSTWGIHTEIAERLTRLREHDVPINKPVDIAGVVDVDRPDTA